MDGLIRDVRESMVIRAIRLDETHQHPAMFKLAATIAFLLTLVGVWQAINSDGAKNISKRRTPSLDWLVIFIILSDRGESTNRPKNCGSEFSDNCSDTLRPRTAADLLCDRQEAMGLDVL